MYVVLTLVTMLTAVTAKVFLRKYTLTRMMKRKVAVSANMRASVKKDMNGTMI